MQNGTKWTPIWTPLFVCELLHGLTAVPGANVYASAIDAISDKKKDAEIKQVSQLPTRRSHKNHKKG
jgi:hypothetical protein